MRQITPLGRDRGDHVGHPFADHIGSASGYHGDSLSR